MNKCIIFGFILTLLGVGLISCSDREEEVTEYNLDRVLTPFDIKYSLDDIVGLTLTWKDLEEADGYIVELYTDSLQFLEENLLVMDEVLTNKFEYILMGNTQYSARIKSVSTSNNDSKWNGIAFKTSFKSVFLPFEKGDITETSLRFRFPKGTYATLVELKSGSSEISREITDEEINTGILEFTDLLSNVTYTAILYDGDKIIGEVTATTIMDGAIEIKPSDDWKALLESAKEGDAFLFDEGIYLLDEGEEVVTISTSITIMGKIAAEPTIQAQFEIDNLDGANSPSIVFKHVKLEGKDQAIDYAIRLIAKNGNYGDIVLESAEISNYNKAFIASSTDNTSSVKINSINIEDCIVSNIKTDGAEAIDIRYGYLVLLTINNSTFNNVAPGRAFIRLDDASSNYPGMNSVVEVKNSTFYKVNNTVTSKGFFYVRFKTNTLLFKNNLMVQSEGIFSKESKTSDIICENNNYFNAPNYLDGGAITGAKIDTASPMMEDPEFEDPDNGDFTIGNGTLKVGDPRWYN
ncbi:MAG: DUF4957 domain-containing protein [Bacteroidales bacterium]|nr:DUF4957 domain-containing protein [Bacteroidales bacterium]